MRCISRARDVSIYSSFTWIDLPLDTKHHAQATPAAKIVKRLSDLTHRLTNTKDFKDKVLFTSLKHTHTHIYIHAYTRLCRPVRSCSLRLGCLSSSTASLNPCSLTASFKSAVCSSQCQMQWSEGWLVKAEETMVSPLLLILKNVMMLPRWNCNASPPFIRPLAVSLSRG